jgi:hypothetical protein
VSASTAKLVERLTDALAAPVRVPALRPLPGSWRFPCPICAGGMDDWSELPYRPLVVCDDGRVWCDRTLEQGYGPVTCNFTAAKLRAALQLIPVNG